MSGARMAVDMTAHPRPDSFQVCYRGVTRDSDRRLVLVPRTDPHDGVDRRDPDLAVADPAGLGGLHDDLEDLRSVLVVDDDLDADLGHERDVVLSTAVDLGVTLLPPVAADLTDRHAGDAEGLQRLADVLPLVRLDHCGNELHACAPSLAWPP